MPTQKSIWRNQRTDLTKRGAAELECKNSQPGSLGVGEAGPLPACGFTKLFMQATNLFVFVFDNCLPACVDLLGDDHNPELKQDAEIHPKILSRDAIRIEKGRAIRIKGALK